MSLFHHLSLVEDSRSHINQRHNLVDVLFLVLSAVASGLDGWAEIQQFGELRIDWLRKFRPFEHGIPRRHTIARIVQAVAPESFQICLFSWLNEIREQSCKPIIALDGKTLKNASKLGNQTFHSVSAYDLNNGIALYQEMAPGKGKEIATVQRVISMLNIKDAVITMDALNTQRATLEAVISRKGDFVAQVKANQPMLLEAIRTEFAHAFKDDASLAQCETTDKGHGREETRITFQIPANLSPELREKWPFIKTFIATERHRKDKRSNVSDTHFYASSLDIAPKFISGAVRGHWQIENSLHWILDVIYKEDSCRIHDINSVKLLAVARRMSLNLAKLETTEKRSMKSKIQRALLSDDYRELMMFGFVKEI